VHFGRIVTRTAPKSEDGRATYAGRSPDDPAAGTTVEMHGATIIEVDADGLVTLWRDYLDRKEPENQLRAAVRGRPRRTGDG
jgi:limonene-1,2-epoxide hydrolase